MKYWLIFLLFTAHSSSAKGEISPLRGGQLEGPFPGQTAPNFQLKSLKGETIELKTLYDKGPVWLTLFTTWCPDCEIETPQLVATSKKYPNLQFVAVSLMEEKSDVIPFQREHDIPYPVLLDEGGLISDLYQIRPIPVNIGIQKGGIIAFRRQTVSKEDIETLIPLLLDKTSEIPQQTPPPENKAIVERLYTSFPLIASLLAGILTFLSPCVLPLIPVYLSLVTGLELESLIKEEKKAKKHLLASTLFFVLGFGLIFTLLGATASSLGQTLTGFQKYLRIGGGILIIALGLHIAGVFKFLPLYKELRPRLRTTPLGFFGAFLTGVVFAIGWTPCVGPILSSILILSSQQETTLKGTMLLVSYSLGIAIPFILASFFLSHFQKFLKKIKPHFGMIEKFSGALLVLLGVLLLSNKLTLISSCFARL